MLHVLGLTWSEKARGKRMVFEFTQFSMPLFPSVSHSIPLTSLDLSLWLFDVNIYTPYQFRDLSDLSLNHFSPITSLSLPSLSLSLCVIVWYGRNVTHAEAAAATATTHSSVYGQLTSGLSDFEVRGHQAHTLPHYPQISICNIVLKKWATMFLVVSQYSRDHLPPITYTQKCRATNPSSRHF